MRAENDRLAHEHVRLKKLGLITDLVFDRSKICDGLAELPALQRVFDRFIHREFGPSYSTGAQFDPAGIQDIQCDLKTSGSMSQKILHRNRRIIKEKLNIKFMKIDLVF